MLEADLRGWLPLLGIVLEERLIEDILREAEVVLRPFVTHHGTRVSFASPALLATAAKLNPDPGLARADGDWGQAGGDPRRTS
jgi:hypothetical protein